MCRDNRVCTRDRRCVGLCRILRCVWTIECVGIIGCVVI